MYHQLCNQMHYKLLHNIKMKVLKSSFDQRKQSITDEKKKKKKKEMIN